uniref:Uncharacterized protein n=1 Tax=Kuenenia stuttgartiensis TaxID=174633 RepID=Q1PW95_KUEST|nr:unknown protein [Candidatus Kuenenia stuttgartiensis]
MFSPIIPFDFNSTMRGRRFSICTFIVCILSAKITVATGQIPLNKIRKNIAKKFDFIYFSPSDKNLLINKKLLARVWRLRCFRITDFPAECFCGFIKVAKKIIQLPIYSYIHINGNLHWFDFKFYLMFRFTTMQDKKKHYT